MLRTQEKNCMTLPRIFWLLFQIFHLNWKSSCKIFFSKIDDFFVLYEMTPGPFLRCCASKAPPYRE